MISSSSAERQRFELWYNNHVDMELITGPDDVEAAWEIWQAALSGLPVNAIGYVELSGDMQPTRFRTGRFGCGHPVYLSPVSALEGYVIERGSDAYKEIVVTATQEAE